MSPYQVTIQLPYGYGPILAVIGLWALAKIVAFFWNTFLGKFFG